MLKMPQSRPTGPKYQVTAEWVAWVRSRMDELGLNQSDLADIVDVTPAAISDILRGATMETRLLPQINAALGGVPPTQIVVLSPLDEAKAVVDQLWDELSDEEKSHVVATIRMFTRPRSGE
jgi:transcriptional regulator with XRE-family HTH domain